MKNYKMYRYIPFAKNNLDFFNTEEISTAYPGHLIGVFFRFQGITGIHPRWVRVSISDIGTTKEYILRDTHLSLFMEGYHDYIPSGWMNPSFILLDHKIKNNHRVLLEVRAVGNINAYGFFVYKE